MADNSKSVDRLAAQIKKSHPSWSHEQVTKRAREAVIRTEKRNPKK